MCLQPQSAGSPSKLPRSQTSAIITTAATKQQEVVSNSNHLQDELDNKHDDNDDDDELSSSTISISNKIINWIKYLISLSLLLFSIILIISLIFHESTKLSKDVSPTLALVVMWGAILWLAMMEGQQAALVGLAPVVDHLVYKESHPIAFKNTQLVYLGNNMDRYLTGRQFMVLLSVFIINLCGAPLPEGTTTTTSSSSSSLTLFGFTLPTIIQQIFLGSGLAMILMTAMIGQLTTQVNASHCMIDFINNYFALFTLYTALTIEFSGIMHAGYLIQNIISILSGKPIKSNEEPRTWIQSSFFWSRVVLSLAILCFSMAVTVVALFQGKTTMWAGVPEPVSLLLFFLLLALVGMLEGMQIAFYASSKMKKNERGTTFFGKKTSRVISKKNNLPAFMIGRQLMVVSCFFVLARVTTLDVQVGMGENIFGVSDGVQSFLNTGLHAALLMTIMGAVVWKLAASAFPMAFFNAPFTYVLLMVGLVLEASGICSGSWVLARILKKVMKLQVDEVYVGTPEKPILSKDALDEIISSRDALDEATRRLEEGTVVTLEEVKQEECIDIVDNDVDGGELQSSKDCCSDRR